MKSGLESTPDSLETKLRCGWLHQTCYMPETQTSATRQTGPMTLSPSPGPLGRPLRQATARPSTFQGSGPQKPHLSTKAHPLPSQLLNTHGSIPARKGLITSPPSSKLTGFGSRPRAPNKGLEPAKIEQHVNLTSQA